MSNYLGASVPEIMGRLAAPNGTPLMGEAGVEIIAPGALTLAQLASKVEELFRR